MYTDEDLDGAVSAGVINRATADALRDHFAASRQAPRADEEHFRLISGFNDVFVVIASCLLLLALGVLGASATPSLGPLLVAASAWGLAEFFVRQRRMALPAIVLLIAFVAATFGAALLLLLPGNLQPQAVSEGLDRLPWTFAMASAITAAAAYLHWRRFRVPITVAAGVIALVATALAVLMALVPAVADALPALVFLAGAATFWYALRWDMRDVRRQTRSSDVAFWLHLAAAPMLVHPVFNLLGVFDDNVSLLHLLVILVLYVGIALLSLLIDRRALMVSSLGYVLFALQALIRDAAPAYLSFSITALVVGSGLLLLSAFWHRSRLTVTQWLPSPLRTALPPA